MNDFTKGELETIRYLINNMDEKILTQSEHVILVQSKIQSMIDNYCEHDCKATIWICQVTACSKCGYPSTLMGAKK